MLNLFMRCIVVYFFLLVAMRLMGKRQLSELQPFEFAITLVASDLACIPMSDPTIPIIYGIIPVFTLFVVHIIITKLASGSPRFRKLLNGKPIVVIEKGNLLPDVLKELNMNIDDMLEALRSGGYFDPGEVEYAIIETNGTMTVLPKSQFKPLTPSDISLRTEPADMPVTVVMEGNFMGANMKGLRAVDKGRVMHLLDTLGMKQSDVLLLLVTGDKVFVQPYKGDSMTVSFPAEDGE